MPKKKSRSPAPGDSQFCLFQVVEGPNAYRKAVQVVHSKPRAPMSLLQRKLSNAWLKNAVETQVDAQGWWTISTSSMAVDIGFDSNNREYLRQSALNLMHIIFEWDVVAPEKKRVTWKASVLFPDVEISGDSIRYQISNQLRDSVLNPDMYALIDLNIVKRFRRASSLAIYEHCIRYEKLGRTAEVEWQKFRDIALGESSESKSYREYKHFNGKVLKLAVAEINAESDILIELHETKIGRRINAVHFTVAKKGAAIEAEPMDELTLEVIGEMIKLGVPQSEAKRISRNSAIEEVKAALSYTKRRVADKKAQPIENPAAYFRQALSNHWGVIEDVTAKTPTAGKAKSAAGRPLKTIDDAYLARQIKQAEQYFNELDVADQDANITRYNDQQQTEGLKIKKRKATAKGAQVAFFRWLAVDTWGSPSAEQLLEFAQELLAEKTGG